MYRLILLAFVAFATSVSAQDPVSDDETSPDSGEETVEGLSEEELEDLDIDSQQDHSEDDEDVFKPTDVVSYTQPVSFPTDI